MHTHTYGMYAGRRMSIADARRASIALSQNPALQSFRLMPVKEEYSDEFDSLLPPIDKTTKTLFEAHVKYLLIIVHFESFDNKDRCMDALCVILDNACSRLRVDIHVSHHPDDDVSELYANAHDYANVVCNSCSAAETDTGRIATTGMSLQNLFANHQITRRYLVIVCCGEDMDYDVVSELNDYINDRHPGITAYGSVELQKLSRHVKKRVKPARKT